MFEDDGDPSVAGRGEQPDRDAEKRRDRQRHSDRNATHRAAHDHALVVDLDEPDLSVGTGIGGAERHRQCERVEPQCATRPGRLGPAGTHSTPH